MPKVMGFHDDLHIAGKEFSSLEVDAASFRRCEFVDLALSNSSLYYVNFENCSLSGIELAQTSLSHVSLFDSTVTGVAQPIPVKALKKLFNCTISGVELVGARSTHLDSLVVRGGSVSGSLSNVSFVEDKESSQLSGTDLSDAELHTVRFVGVPMERVIVADHVTKFIVPNWVEHAGAVSDYANAAMGKHSVESPEYRAAFHVFQQVQQDWERFRFAHGRGNDGARGGRFIAEAVNEQLPPSVQTAVIELYRAVTGIDFS